MSTCSSWSKCTTNNFPHMQKDGTLGYRPFFTRKLCTVVLSEEFSACDTDRETAELAVHSVAATLCALNEIEQVQLQLPDGEDLTYCSIAEPLSPDRTWDN